MGDYSTSYETLDEGTIARIMLNRPESRNADNPSTTRPQRHVPRGRGRRPGRDPRWHRPLFSSGHDMGSKQQREEMYGDNPHIGERTAEPQSGRTACSRSGTTSTRTRSAGVTSARSRSRRSMAPSARPGSCSCDLIVAAGAFADVVGTRLGMCSLEYFAHPWEFGPRKTRSSCSPAAIDVDEAHRLEMVRKVFPDDASSPTVPSSSPRRIAALPTMTALLIKESVNKRRQHGLPERAGRVLHDPPAQSLALGRGPRRRVSRGDARRRHRVVEGRTARRTGRQGRSAYVRVNQN